MQWHVLTVDCLKLNGCLWQIDSSIPHELRHQLSDARCSSILEMVKFGKALRVNIIDLNSSWSLHWLLSTILLVVILWIIIVFFRPTYSCQSVKYWGFRLKLVLVLLGLVHGSGFKNARLVKSSHSFGWMQAPAKLNMLSAHNWWCSFSWMQSRSLSCILSCL